MSVNQINLIRCRGIVQRTSVPFSSKTLIILTSYTRLTELTVLPVHQNLSETSHADIRGIMFDLSSFSNCNSFLTSFQWFDSIRDYCYYSFKL